MLPPFHSQSGQGFDVPEQRHHQRTQQHQQLPPQHEQAPKQAQQQQTQEQRRPRPPRQRIISTVSYGGQRRRGTLPAPADVGNGLKRGFHGVPGPVVQPPEAQGDAPRSLVIPFDGETAAQGPPAVASTPEPLQVTVLGAGQDVGRSAVYVRQGERGLLFDCGSHLGAKQARKLPLLDLLLQLSPQQHLGQETQTMEEALLQPSPLFASCTDAAIISHFHMDHCGSLPSFTERLGWVRS